MPESSDARLTELYRLYGPVIYSRCRRMLGGDAAARDATQEVFLRVWKNLARSPSQDEILAWIHRIATNYCLNQLRGGSLRIEPRAELPEVAVEQLEARMLSRDLLERLVRSAPEKLQEVAWLYYLDGLKQEQVADVLGCTRRTVINRLAAFSQAAREMAAR
ncbi:MAG TPA: sigma-70 family RNA polymerase sigma factor [Myxococcales bacterium]|nr:sigma-70 family RNA polymerase sigma factor [Myxococcales bacterium]